MAIDLKILVNISPIEQETKHKLLQQINSFSEDQKYRLSEVCWKALADQYHVKVTAQTEKILLDARIKGEDVNPEEIKKIEVNLTQEYAKLLNSASTEEEVHEVREQLKQYQAQPFKQDAVDPNFQPRVDSSTPVDRPQDLMKKTE